MRMGRSDVQFQKALQKVLNVVPGAKAEFDTTVVELPSTKISFLVKISKASGNTLLEVADHQPDKLTRLIVSSYAPATSSFSSKTFGRTSSLKDSEPKELTDGAASSRA
nr:hypothetical protein [Tanacetum cinerariifolium]